MRHKRHDMERWEWRISSREKGQGSPCAKGMKIFISYAGKDELVADGWISKFSDAIQREVAAIRYASQVEVFFAEESIEYGEDFRKKYLSYINTQLDYFVPFLSPQFFQSIHCMEELNTAMKLVKAGAKCVIIPIYFIGSQSYESLIAGMKGNSAHGESGVEELQKEIGKRKCLDWRAIRFSFSDAATKREINRFAIRLTAAHTLPKQSEIQPAMERNSKEKIAAANNNDVYIRQENQYDRAITKLFHQCVERLDEDKTVFILELDYRKVEGIKKHLQRYENLPKSLGQVFVLCTCNSEMEDIEKAELKYVTPFLLEGELTGEQLRDIWERNGFPKPDIIFSDRNYRRLKDPVHDYMVIRRDLLGEKGSCIIKGFDDGCKICYPDPDNVLHTIIEATANRKNVSDRMNGRKIFTNLKLAGFSEFARECIVNDTMAMGVDERYSLYEESFDFRKNYFQEGTEERSSVEKALLRLRDYFCSDSFYYCEINFFVAGMK